MSKSELYESVYPNAFADLVEEPEISEEEREQVEKEREERAKARERHCNTKVMPYCFPMIWIKDKYTGAEHLYGTDSHDSLWIDGDGSLQYYNLQNGDGTGEGGGYEFVDHSDDEGYGAILHYYLDIKEVH